MTAKVTRPAADPDDGILRIGDTVEEPKYDVLFRMRGKEYAGLTNPPASVLVGYLDVLRKRNYDVALSWMLEEILDTGAYTALTTDPAVSRDDFRQVCDVVRGLVFGTPDIVPKSPRSGSRRAGG